MDDYDFPSQDPQAASDRRAPSGPGGGFTLQTGASVLLIAVIAAVLWLFLGPMPGPDSGIDLPTPTSVFSTPAVATPGPAQATPSSVAPTQPSSPGPPAAGTTEGAGAAPGAVSAGTFVRVSGTEGLGLRFRLGPGPDYATVRIVDDGEVLLVQGDPQTSRGRTWWRLQDSVGNFGWAIDEFLDPTTPPGNWNPPSASPTFPAREAVGTPGP